MQARHPPAHTLTEAPEQWGENLARWRQMNQTQVRFLNDGTAPNAADTWMIYQALAGGRSAFSINPRKRASRDFSPSPSSGDNVAGQTPASAW